MSWWRRDMRLRVLGLGELGRLLGMSWASGGPGYMSPLTMAKGRLHLSAQPSVTITTAKAITCKIHLLPMLKAKETSKGAQVLIIHTTA